MNTINIKTFFRIILLTFITMALFSCSNYNMISDNDVYLQTPTEMDVTSNHDITSFNSYRSMTRGRFQMGYYDYDYRLAKTNAQVFIASSSRFNPYFGYDNPFSWRNRLYIDCFGYTYRYGYRYGHINNYNYNYWGDWRYMNYGINYIGPNSKQNSSYNYSYRRSYNSNYNYNYNYNTNSNSNSNRRSYTYNKNMTNSTSRYNKTYKPSKTAIKNGSINRRTTTRTTINSNRRSPSTTTRRTTNVSRNTDVRRNINTNKSRGSYNSTTRSRGSYSISGNGRR